MASRNPDNRNPQAPQAQNPNKYINDFTKVLAGEVRTLLSEVGRLREEKAQLQSEIGELMHLKSRNGGRAIGPGGELAIFTGAPPGWPSSPLPDQIPGSPPPPMDPAEPSRPAWRTVTKRQIRKKKEALPPPEMPSSPPPPDLPAWAQWKPNPHYSPALMGSPHPGSPPPASSMKSGLFGPPSPK